MASNGAGTTRVPTKAEDEYFRDGTVTEVHGGVLLWHVTLAGGETFSLGMEHGIKPRLGQRARVYLDAGHPWGLPRARVRGVDLDAREVFYRAPREETLRLIPDVVG